MNEYLPAEAVVSLKMRENLACAERARAKAVADLMLAAFSNLLVDAVSELAFRRGPLVFFRFPKAHTRVLQYLQETGLPHLPVNEDAVTKAAIAAGIAASWLKRGRADYIWWLYPKDDDTGFPVLAVEATRFPAVIVPREMPFDVCFGYKNERRRNYAAYAGHDYTPLFPR